MKTVFVFLRRLLVFLQEILLGIAGISLVAGMLVFLFLCFIRPVILSQFFTYSIAFYSYPIVFYLIISMVTVVTICYLLFLLFIRKLEKYDYIPLFRLLIFGILLILLPILSVLIVITLLGDSVPDKLSAIIELGAFSRLCILVLLEFAMLQNFFFFAYDRDKYILYLRSFQFDRHEQEIEEKLRAINYPILKIGNPKALFPKGFGEVFYLPTTNWKPHLHYYINHASFVICVIDVTEGVLWEIFEHLDNMHKFIYYFSDKEHLRHLISNSQYSQKYGDTILMECLQVLLSYESLKSSAFYVKDNLCYYADINTIVNFAPLQRSDPSIPSFKLQLYCEAPDVSKTREDYNDDDFSYRLDITRKIQRFVKQECFQITGFFGCITLVPMALILVLLCIAATIGGVFLSFAPDSWHESCGLVAPSLEIRIGYFGSALIFGSSCHSFISGK